MSSALLQVVFLTVHCLPDLACMGNYLIGDPQTFFVIYSSSDFLCGGIIIDCHVIVQHRPIGAVCFLYITLTVVEEVNARLH